jgi:hypothetical protein
VINLASPLSPAVAQLAPPLATPLTTKAEVWRREKKCRKKFVVEAQEIEKKTQNRGSGVDLRT